MLDGAFHYFLSYDIIRLEALKCKVFIIFKQGNLNDIIHVCDLYIFPSFIVKKQIKQ